MWRNNADYSQKEVLISYVTHRLSHRTQGYDSRLGGVRAVHFVNFPRISVQNPPNHKQDFVQRRGYAHKAPQRVATSVSKRNVRQSLRSDRNHLQLHLFCVAQGFCPRQFANRQGVQKRKSVPFGRERQACHSCGRGRRSVRVGHMFVARILQQQDRNGKGVCAKSAQ